MLCPKCNRDCSVINSRQKDYGRMRRYECPDCKERFTTVETIDEGFRLGKPSETVMGYNMKDLLVFAEACRKCGVEDHDLLRFSRDVGAGLEFVVRYEQEMIENAIKHCASKTVVDIKALCGKEEHTMEEFMYGQNLGDPAIGSL